MLKDIWAFVKQHRMGTLMVYNIIITGVFIFIFLWYLPVAQDVKGIYAHLMREEDKKANAEQFIKKHERETVKITVHEDVAESLEHVGNEIKEIQQSLTVVDENDKKISAGINDTIGKWQISVYEGNKHKLKNGDMVVVTNRTYGKHRPSAIFEVVSVVNKNDISTDSADIFISTASAESLDIPVRLGIFEVNYRVLPKPLK